MNIQGLCQKRSQTYKIISIKKIQWLEHHLHHAEYTHRPFTLNTCHIPTKLRVLLTAINSLLILDIQ